MASHFDSSPVGIFFNSLRKIQSDLPDEIFHQLDGIKKKLENDNYQSLWSLPTSYSISLLDHLNDALAECHILNQQQASIGKKTDLFSCSKYNTERNIKDLLSPLERIIDEGSQANENPSIQTTNFWTGQSSASDVADQSPVSLYDEEEKNIVRCLRSEGFKAIGIHGMCGSGKTVLVEKVLKNEEVRNMFCPIISICLSDMSPKEQGDTKVVKHLLELLNDDVDERTGSNRDVDPVGILEKHLMPCMFLIVLDDVWFCSGIVEVLPRNSGGAVIVTSRVKHVAEKMVGNECLFHLKPWESDKGKCLEAVVEEKVTGQEKVTSGYKDMANELLVRIHGLPLAAKTLKKYHEMLKNSRESSSNISS